MPDKRQHRGPHPLDRELFAAEIVPTLARAVADLSWLLTRGYSEPAALKLVGDRFQLHNRQRLAVMRAACSDEALRGRLARCIPLDQLAGKAVVVDGFNVLTTIEAALAGGVVLWCRDGCLRDMASMHGSYRRVAESRPAVELIGRESQRLQVGAVHWFLDRPVSNSGRLATLIRELAEQHGWNWTVTLDDSPDARLIASDDIVISADSVILDRCGSWANWACDIVTREFPDAWFVRLDVSAEPAC